MWLKSNSPAFVRTATASSRMPVYWTGMFQPANGTMRAPRDTCAANSGVSCRVVILGARGGGRGRLSSRPVRITWVGSGSESGGTRERTRRLLAAELVDQAIEIGARDVLVLD